MTTKLTLEDMALGDLRIGDARAVVFDALESLNRSSAQQIYAAFRDWLWKAINGRRRDEELKDWYDLMRRAASRLSQEHSPISERMAALYELLYESLATAEALPAEVVAKRKHVSSIVNLLAVAHGGTVDRMQIQAILGLGEANLSRILTMMEAAGFVEKTTVGKHVNVTLTQTGRAFASSAVASNLMVAEPAVTKELYTDAIKRITQNLAKMYEGVGRPSLLPHHSLAELDANILRQSSRYEPIFQSATFEKSNQSDQWLVFDKTVKVYVGG